MMEHTFHFKSLQVQVCELYLMGLTLIYLTLLDDVYCQSGVNHIYED